jgi:hypothetical protein
VSVQDALFFGSGVSGTVAGLEHAENRTYGWFAEGFDTRDPGASYIRWLDGDG